MLQVSSSGGALARWITLTIICCSGQKVANAHGSTRRNANCTVLPPNVTATVTEPICAIDGCVTRMYVSELSALKVVEATTAFVVPKETDGVPAPAKFATEIKTDRPP
eukprot:2326717-Rhodomonas_salina.1